ncbi:MAG: FKBP-type peptidyl-prolyl cis-trans isomerase [Deltaproteobacteria bacterium]|jgi:FKBP-type peptidyl-prolyl cis-trans isomerase|nr:FKBP-type peptidyl-prolyl cis-trans isomerase [Deltaproteobacteria bacterium]MBW2541425.1 FKBP-type peptidyl-prolyl cis-trans isomerase [Deltaproteobacteria bacterium]
MTTTLNRRTTLHLILTASLIANFACTDQGGGSSGASGTPSEDDKIFYSIGLMAGAGISEFELTEAEFEWVARGVADAALGREALTNPEDHMPQIQEIFAARKARANAAEAAASAEFLEQEAAAEGAVKSDSGLIMKVLVAGEGAQPGPTDEVKVHYHGTLRDGTVFDSSVDRGTPAQFPLDRVIPCWTEAVTQMKVGGKSRIVCPAAIAYGSRGMGLIPGDAALVFEVELLEIVE